MDSEDKKNLQQIAEDVRKLVAAIPKPVSRIQRVFDALATFATVAGLLGIIQIIIQWIGG